MTTRPIRVKATAADDVKKFAAQLTGHAGRTVHMSEALTVALTVARDHMTEAAHMVGGDDTQ